MSTIKRQHYVPQFYLRGFALPDGAEKLHVYDKPRRQKFVAGVKDVASRRYYYDTPEVAAMAKVPQAVEKWLGVHEQTVAPILAATLDSLAAGTFRGFTDEEKIELATFIAIQHIRTEEARERTAQLYDSFPQEILDAFPEVYATARAARTREGRAKFHVELLLSSVVSRVAAVLAARSWVVLQRTQTPWLFFTSDNPVSVVSLRDDGLAVGPCSPGVEVSMPLSPDYMLSIVPIPYPLKVAPCSREDVRRFNLIRIDSATAQVFSQNGDFRLVEKRIDEFPEIANPKRQRVTTNGGPRRNG